MSDLGNLAVGLVMLGSFSIGAARKLIERRRARRALRERPDLSELGDAPDEGVEARVTGIVRATETLFAPVSGLPCVVYRSRVTSSGGLVKGAFKPRESLAMVPFELERDDGTRVAIDGAHALLDLPNLPLSDPRSADERDRRAKFLLLHGLPASNGGTFEEVLVEAGMRVAIAGLVMKDLKEPDSEAGYREEKTSLRLAGNGEHPLVIGEPDERT